MKAGGDVALPLLHGPPDGAEEEGVEDEGEEHHLHRHQGQGGIKVEETSLGRSGGGSPCLGKQ